MIPSNSNKRYVKDALDDLIDEVAQECQLSAESLNSLHACRGNHPWATDKTARDRWIGATFVMANHPNIPRPYYHRLLRIGRHPSELNDGPEGSGDSL